MNKDERWQQLAKAEQEAMKLWGMITALIIIGLAVAAVAVIQ